MCQNLLCVSACVRRSMVKPQRSEVKIIIFVSPIFYFCCCLGALGVTTCILTTVPPPSLSSSRLHGHAIFGVVSVSDTGTGTTRWIPGSGECPLFFFFFVSPTRADSAPTRLRHSSDAAPTLPTRQQLRKKRKFRHISGHSGHSGQFRPK